jgi:hypothetical protein
MVLQENVVEVSFIVRSLSEHSLSLLLFAVFRLLTLFVDNAHFVAYTVAWHSHLVRCDLFSAQFSV